MARKKCKSPATMYPHYHASLASTTRIRYDYLMIASLSGTVRSIKTTFFVLDVQGVGYKVHSIPRLLENTHAGDELSIFTHLAVREDALELFGFSSYEELELFQMLIGISGIGPRGALGIIGLETIEKLVRAISQGDIGYLTKVSGVGKKSAEKIVLELRDKVGTIRIENIGESTRHEDEDILEALQTLGYRADEAREALRHLPQEVVGQSARIKEALRLIARK